MGKERKFEGRKFQVTTQELVEEGVEMLMSHQPNADGKNVIHYLIDHGIDAGDHDVSSFWVTRVGRTFWRQFNWIDIDNTFLSFDSHWHNYDDNHYKNIKAKRQCAENCRNQHKVTHADSSTIAVGTDVNYFFQGVIHYVFGFTYERTLARSSMERQDQANDEIISGCFKF